MSLIERYSLFVDEYLKDYDAGSAYVRTYGAGTRKRSDLEKAGNALLRDPWIESEVQRKRVGRLTLADITPGRLAIEYARLAFSDVRKLYNTTEIINPATGERVIVEVPIPISELDDDTALAITEVTAETPRSGRKIKMADKLGALNALAKISGFGDVSGQSKQRDRSRSGQLAPASDHDALEEGEILALIEEFNESDTETIDVEESEE